MSAFRRTRSVSSPALQRLLDDAAAPAHPHELDGLAAALTAFSQTPTPRRPPVKSALVALLSAKALTVTASAAAVGGIALAASTGTLPGTASPHATPGTPGAHNSASPSPSQVGLCRAYLAGVKDARGKALDNPAFSTLAAAAGAAEGVDAYCARVLAAAPGGRPSDLPSQASDHPTGKPADHPTGKPASVPPSHPGKPGDVPPAHPTGSPAVVPPPHPTGSPS
jgi:hypothetical protein